MNNPQIGEQWTYTIPGGRERTVMITGISVESGEPVFDGISFHEGPVWGYFSQLKECQGIAPKDCRTCSSRCQDELESGKDCQYWLARTKMKVGIWA